LRSYFSDAFGCAGFCTDHFRSPCFLPRDRCNFDIEPNG
jgi:hypothetical protein